MKAGPAPMEQRPAPDQAPDLIGPGFSRRTPRPPAVTAR
jgi:hypothetical protein